MGTKTGHGGRRAGAGRPPNKPPPVVRAFTDAADYLRAVLSGEQEPDALRISAAKALLPYERQRLRAPVASASAKELQRGKANDDEAQQQAEWRERAAKVRAKHRATAS